MNWFLLATFISSYERSNKPIYFTVALYCCNNNVLAEVIGFPFLEQARDHVLDTQQFLQPRVQSDYFLAFQHGTTIPRTRQVSR